jgi:hypothetical protein
MNQDQYSNSENLPHSSSTISSNSQDITIPQNAEALHVTTAVQDINIHPHPQYDNTQTLNQQTLQTTLVTTPFHPTIFFYQPPNDLCHYYVNCKEISYDTVTYILNKSLKENNVQHNENECIFYYQQQFNTKFYQVSCEIVSPSLINNCLNKNFLGIEFQQIMEKENLTFAFEQKEYLENWLKQYLSQYLLK